MKLPAPEDFSDRVRAAAVTARVGTWLGVCFVIAFGTGLISHWAQQPDPAVTFPTWPAWGYRVSQGLHVAAGTAAVPLLLVKLWAVYPQLFRRPPRAAVAALTDGLERASIGVLVSASLFQLATGLANTAGWYPWPFSFRATHFAVAWLAVGGLVVHLGVKLPRIRAGYAERLEPDRAPGVGLSRRGLLRVTTLASAAAVVTTAGATVPWLRRVSVFAVRSGTGPAGVPVNKSAVAAGVLEAATSPAYRLVVAYAGDEVALTRGQLEAMPHRTRELPIACVEGWSAQGRWGGVRLRDVLDLVGAPPGRAVRVTSLQGKGPFRATTLPADFADHEDTLLALTLGGEPLDLDHGYPTRLIAPNRPGVLQTKWVCRLEVL